MTAETFVRSLIIFGLAIGLIERAMRLIPNAAYPIWGLRHPLAGA